MTPETPEPSIAVEVMVTAPSSGSALTPRDVGMSFVRIARAHGFAGSASGYPNSVRLTGAFLNARTDIDRAAVAQAFLRVVENVVPLRSTQTEEACWELTSLRVLDPEELDREASEFMRYITHEAVIDAALPPRSMSEIEELLVTASRHATTDVPGERPKGYFRLSDLQHLAREVRPGTMVHFTISDAPAQQAAWIAAHGAIATSTGDALWDDETAKRAGYPLFTEAQMLTRADVLDHVRAYAEHYGFEVFEIESGREVNGRVSPLMDLVCIGEADFAPVDITSAALALFNRPELTQVVTLTSFVAADAPTAWRSMEMRNFGGKTCHGEQYVPVDSAAALLGLAPSMVDIVSQRLPQYTTGQDLLVFVGKQQRVLQDALVENIAERAPDKEAAHREMRSWIINQRLANQVVDLRPEVPHRYLQMQREVPIVRDSE